MRAWHLEDLSIAAAWKLHETRGADVKVALLDTGAANIDALSHVQRLTPSGAPYVGRSQDVSPVAHGTQTASLLGSRAAELLGVAPDCELLSYGVADISGEPLPSLVGRAMNSAVLLGAELLCCPFTLSESTDEFEAGLEAARAAGIPIVVAAGNDARARLSFPLETHAVVTVGAANRNGRVQARYRWFDWVSVSAPGDKVPTWTARNITARSFTGSSAAAPIVAGISALGIARAKALDASGALAKEVRARLPELLRETASAPSRYRGVNPAAFLDAVTKLAPPA